MDENLLYLIWDVVKVIYVIGFHLILTIMVSITLKNILLMPENYMKVEENS